MTPSDLRGAMAGRPVFVTGHTGFMGSWLALWLQTIGARVTGYALPPPTEPSHFVAAGIGQLLAEHHEADVRDAARMAAAVRAARPDAVIHLAAQPLVRESYRDPRTTFEVNVQGTVNLLDAVRLAGRPAAVIVITSDKCYENREQVWGYREADPIGGHDPYSASKGAAEIVAASYRRSFFAPARLAEHGVQLATVRAGNVIGGGDWARDRIVPDLARRLASGEAVPVRSPRAVRPWQHVLEPLSGCLALAAKMLTAADAAWAGGWNFGPRTGDEATVAELASRFCTAWGSGRWTDASDPRAPHEAVVLRLCIDKAMIELGWRPRWNIDMTVARTAAWYKRYYAGPASSMRESSLDDIREYQRAAGEAPGAAHP